jgi:hypothetical protein
MSYRIIIPSLFFSAARFLFAGTNFCFRHLSGCIAFTDSFFKSVFMSVELSIAQALIHQLGPAVSEIESIVQEEIDSWVIRFFNGEYLHITFQTSPSRWVMSCQLDQPDDSNQVQVYEAMLCTNLLYQGVAPVKVALSEPGGVLLLIGEFQQAGSALEDLQMLLQQFQLVAEHLSDQISLIAEGGLTAQTDCHDAMPVASHILA